MLPFNANPSSPQNFFDTHRYTTNYLDFVLLSFAPSPVLRFVLFFSLFFPTTQLFEQDIGPLKRSLSVKTRRFSRISDLALVTMGPLKLKWPITSTSCCCCPCFRGVSLYLSYTYTSVVYSRRACVCVLFIYWRFSCFLCVCVCVLRVFSRSKHPTYLNPHLVVVYVSVKRRGFSLYSQLLLIFLLLKLGLFFEIRLKFHILDIPMLFRMTLACRGAVDRATTNPNTRPDCFYGLNCIT